MQITSSAFEDNGLIPPKYTCDGQNLSPPLTWQNVPSASQSLALICDDPDAPGGTFVHWVIYNLPAALTALPEGIPLQPSLAWGGVQGKNDFGQIGYGGPCPPRGTHHYYFTLYALDQPLNLGAGASKQQVLQAISSRQLAAAQLVGRYQRSRP